MGRIGGLITHLQLSLAHYCDIHGPTPLMVTEGLPAPCSTCYDDTGLAFESRPRSSASLNATRATTPTASTNVADAFRDLNLDSRAASGASAEHQPSPRPFLRSPNNGLASGVDTPPGSPHQPQQQQRLDSSFRRTYDDTVTKKQGPCDNCAMTLPKRSATPPNNPEDAARGPTLRTRAPAERVFGAGGQQSPPNSQTSSDTDGERETPRQPRNRKIVEVSGSRTTSCSSASTASENAPFHLHYVDYTSTHEPVLASSFSLLRASCLRTLSFETLPRAPTTAAPTTSPHATNPQSFVTTQSAGSAVSGGPIFFGDALAGYTTAYIFRIPDIHARGHKRIYAFIALSTHKERLAMKTFAIISAAFRELATWIQQLAEAEAERVAESSPVSSVFYSGGGGGITQSTASAFDQPTTSDRGGSSFLTAGKGLTRRMGGGGGGASAPKARGLAEIVGQPQFFIELHRKFVQLLFEVGVTLNS